METIQLGTSSLTVSRLIMGCWQVDKGAWGAVNEEEIVAAMQEAYDLGITTFDTAEGYGEGESERVLGRAVKDFRNKAIIATKVGPWNFSAEKVAEACNRSLKNLQTDYIDLYQLHWPSGTWGTDLVPLEETMTALLKLQEEGKIREIGVSNFNSALITEALGYGRIESLQPPYPLFFHPYEDDGTVRTCMDSEMGIIAYSPLAQGLLTEKFSMENRPSEGDNRSGNVLFQDPTYGLALTAMESLSEIARRNSCTPGQLALRWLLSRPGLTAAIVGARTGAQVRDNAKAVALSLSTEDSQLIDSIGASVSNSLPADRTNPWA